MLESDEPYFYDPIAFTETVHEATGEKIILYDEILTPQYASIVPGYLPYQEFLACPCAEGYSRLNPGTNEACFNCQSVIPNCNDCTLDSGDIICLRCNSEYFILTADNLTCQPKLTGCRIDSAL